jgi:tRNA-guanine transglycosylase
MLRVCNNVIATPTSRLYHLAIRFLSSMAAIDAPKCAAPYAGIEPVPIVPFPEGPWTPSHPSITSITPGERYDCGPALKMTVDGVCGRARALTLHLPHGPVATPVFMPVGTQGTIKGLTTVELQLPPLDCEIILGNTYHLGSRPGGAIMEKMGGLHNFMGWPRNLLTDSGGFQMVSLLALAEITEEGVTFANPTDGKRMLLTPEQSIQLQNQIGSDIMMALDDVVDSKTVNDERFREACARTLRWIDRCISAHSRPTEQNLFGIVQGGLDISPGGLRDISLVGMKERDANLPGYAIGGLAGGEDKEHFWSVVNHCTKQIPKAKPCYLMGVGYPLDIVVCTALGVDMYDCVYPTRTARFGTALIHSGLLKLKSAAMSADPSPLDPTCPCFVCRQYSREYLSLLCKTEGNAAQLLTYHNIAYMMRLVREMRAAILGGFYPDYVRCFVSNMFPDPSSIPAWVTRACKQAEIDLFAPVTNDAAKAYFKDMPRADVVPSASQHAGIDRGEAGSALEGGEGKVVVPIRKLGSKD